MPKIQPTLRLWFLFPSGCIQNGRVQYGLLSIPTDSAAGREGKKHKQAFVRHLGRTEVAPVLQKSRHALLNSDGYGTLGLARPGGKEERKYASMAARSSLSLAALRPANLAVDKLGIPAEPLLLQRQLASLNFQKSPLFRKYSRAHIEIPKRTNTAYKNLSYV